MSEERHDDEARGPWEDARRARREARRAERDARRAQRSARKHMHFSTHGVEFGFDPDELARSISSAFVSTDDGPGEVHEETIEREFTVSGTPHLRVRNVSGDTTIRTGDAGRVHVVAHKKVRGASEDRSKRLLENVEVRIEQHGDAIRVEPHLYEQERGWLDLFRGKRFRVDFEITIPRECVIEAQTVSGELDVRGTRGPIDVGTVSGDIQLEDVQGPLRIKAVSGDVDARDYVGHVEGNSVSGDVSIAPARVRSVRFQSVSGDLSLEGELEPSRENRLKTISGDIELNLVSPSSTIEFRTASGDLETNTEGVPTRIVREGKHDRTVVLGGGGTRLLVKTVSGDLNINAKRSDGAREAEPAAEAMVSPEPAAESDVERTEPMAPQPDPAVREVLERLARGELGVDEAAAQLDAKRGR